MKLSEATLLFFGLQPHPNQKANGKMPMFRQIGASMTVLSTIFFG